MDVSFVVFREVESVSSSAGKYSCFYFEVVFGGECFFVDGVVEWFFFCVGAFMDL